MNTPNSCREWQCHVSRTPPRTPETFYLYDHVHDNDLEYQNTLLCMGKALTLTQRPPRASQ